MEIKVFYILGSILMGLGMGVEFGSGAALIMLGVCFIVGAMFGYLEAGNKRKPYGGDQ